MNDAPDEHVVVYRSYDAVAVEMVEGMLETQGLQPRRLGRANAALAGVGSYAVEQGVEVPAAHAERARALVDELDHDADATQAAALEDEALSAAPETNQGPKDTRVGTGAFIAYLALALVLVALLLRMLD